MRHVTLRTLIVLVIMTAGVAIGGDYVLDWYTIDGGGEMFCIGGDYELSGTIGQPDASTIVMTGGDFELVGGFWVHLGPHIPNPPLDPNDVVPGDSKDPKEPEPPPWP